MSSPDLEAVRRHSAAAAALARGDAVAAHAAVESLRDPAALRLAGRALLALGDRDEARRVLRAALELVGEADDPVAAEAHAHEALAAVAKAVGDPAAAVEHLEAALVGAPHEARSALHRDAATLAYRSGDLETAERHGRLALARPSADAVVVARDHARLGAILSEAGEHADALVHLRQAAGQLRAEFGAAHPGVVATQSELAVALEAAGYATEAERLHLAVLEQCEKQAAPSPALMATTLLSLSGLAASRNDHDAARRRAAEAESLLAGRVPADHPLLRAARGARA